jgi:hypothetical protein
VAGPALCVVQSAADLDNVVDNASAEPLNVPRVRSEHARGPRGNRLAIRLRLQRRMTERRVHGDLIRRWMASRNCSRSAARRA